MRRRSHDDWTTGPAKHAPVVVVLALALVLLALSTVRSARETVSVPPYRLDINSATAAELGALPMIGPARAQSIVDDRSANGPFTTIDDLTRIRGIGDLTVDKLRPYARAGGGR